MSRAKEQFSTIDLAEGRMLLASERTFAGGAAPGRALRLLPVG